jgi:pimeloyl-ACP methyl ester carboxylesterase
MLPSMPYHLVLVHGTGARGAPWTREPTSSLCAHLKAALGEPPSFSYSDWSGRNTHRAGADGARALIEHLRDEAPADRPLVLVGHSHGGSVIAHALVQDESLCLAGAVCAIAVVVGIIAERSRGGADRRPDQKRSPARSCAVTSSSTWLSRPRPVGSSSTAASSTR